MSILKGILHHWNKTTQSYDTIHPETEVSQVTDWNQGIVNTLASTALGTLVNTLTSDSLLATMIQKVLTATGVKYSMGQNGYICFGSLFGGLIIQWLYNKESLQTSADGISAALPIAFTNKAFVAVAIDSGSGVIPMAINTGSATYIYWAKVENIYVVAPWFYAIFIGK